MTSPLELVYEKYKHLDGPLSDTEWCTSGEGAAIYAIAGELWRAVKEARNPLAKENITVGMVAAYESGLEEGARKAREDVIYEILKDLGFSCPGGELTPICDLCGANKYCIELRLARPEPKERDPE